MYAPVLSEFLILLAVALAAVALLSRLRLPPILGYLLAGVVIGPHALGWVHDDATTHLLGDLGVAFLLFTIGLEFSLRRLVALKRTLLGLGGAQVAIGTASGAVLAWATGVDDWGVALVVGGALALSSTALVIKQLAEQLELHDRHGELALGVLLFQDLAAVPLLTIIPVLAQAGANALGAAMTAALLKAAIALGLLLAVGKWALRPLLHAVADARYPEVFTLAALVVALAAAGFTAALGLSLALGAFLAGLMLSETEFRHQIEADIRPFRDVLLALFFLTVGMQLDPEGLAGHWHWVVLLVGGLVVGKGVLIALLARAAGYGARSASRTALVLAQGGEFGIALLTLAAGSGLIDAVTTELLLGAVIGSMAVAPVLIRHNGPWSSRWFAPDPTPPEQLAAADEVPAGHVVVCGFGRTGQLIAEVVASEGLPWIALDTDPRWIRPAWERGQPVLYGDARLPGVLKAAGVPRAAVLVVSFDELTTALEVVHAVRGMRADLPILVRARDTAALDALLDAGATEGVPEALETALMLGLQTLLLLELPAPQVAARIRAVEERQYPLLAGYFRTLSEPSADGGRGPDRLRRIVLPAGAWAAGRPLQEVVAECPRAVVTAVLRGRRRELPEPELELAEGDVLLVHGPEEALEAVERRLLLGRGSEE